MQYEVVTGPLTPLDAADTLVATRELIYNVADKHGLRATFAPRIDEYAGMFVSRVTITVHTNESRIAGGVGAHVHISVHQSGSGKFPPPSSNDPSASLAPALTPCGDFAEIAYLSTFLWSAKFALFHAANCTPSRDVSVHLFHPFPP